MIHLALPWQVALQLQDTDQIPFAVFSEICVLPGFYQTGPLRQPLSQLHMQQVQAHKYRHAQFVFSSHVPWFQF